MSTIQRKNRVSIEKVEDWGTPGTPGVNTGVFVESHTPPKSSRKTTTNENEMGRGMASSGSVGELEAQTGQLSMKVYAEGLERIIVSLMGAYSYTDLTGASEHLFRFEDLIESIMHSLHYDEAGKIKAVRSFVITEGTFNYSDGLKLSSSYLADKAIISGNGPLNVTYNNADDSEFKLLNAKFYINDETDPDFTVDNIVNPNGFDIPIKRGFEAKPLTSGKDCIDKPLEKVTPTIDLNLNFPEFDDKGRGYETAFENRDYKKARVVFESEVIPGTAIKKLIEFNFPRLMISSNPDTGTETPLPYSVKMKGMKSKTLPAGMLHLSPYIRVINITSALTGYPVIS